MFRTLNVFGLNRITRSNAFGVDIGIGGGFNVSDFTVEAQILDNRIRCVTGDAVSLSCSLIHRIQSVDAVSSSEFEREAEFETFFDADITGVEFIVVGCNHRIECRRSEFPTEFKCIVRNIAHHKAADRNILVDVSTEVARLRPVRFPMTEFQIELMIAQIVFVISPVKIGEEFIVIFAVDVIAKMRAKHTNHDLRIKIFGLIKTAKVCAEPERF